MNRAIFITLGITTAAICSYLLSISINHLIKFLNENNKSEVSKTEEQCQSGLAEEECKNENRTSITFILGEDKDPNNRYYEEASHYYTHNRSGKTDYVVSSCRSLTEVKDYLKENETINCLPWGTINLVSHGNEWTGLSVRVTPDSKRATVERILEHIQSKEFEPLSAALIDSQTEVFLHGCGVGNSQALVEAVRAFMSGKNYKPLMYAPKLFEYYASVHSDIGTQSERYLAQSWVVSYKMGEKPNMISLMNELREKYQDVPVDWSGSLQREKPRWIGDTYHYTFEVPVKWVIPVSGVVTDLTQEKNQITWLQAQPKILNELAKLQIPIEKFKWSFTNVYIDKDDGSRVRAIYVKGYCTVLCVLQALTDGYDSRLTLQKTFVPDLKDNRFYYNSQNAALASLIDRRN
jgi:hypothetical protein